MALIQHKGGCRLPFQITSTACEKKTRIETTFFFVSLKFHVLTFTFIFLIFKVILYLILFFLKVLFANLMFFFSFSCQSYLHLLNFLILIRFFFHHMFLYSSSFLLYFWIFSLHPLLSLSTQLFTCCLFCPFLFPSFILIFIFFIIIPHYFLLSNFIVFSSSSFL